MLVNENTNIRNYKKKISQAQQTHSLRSEI
jgi:hypothetical protein